MLRTLTVLLAAALAVAFAQDDRRVSSPDGRVEFHLFNAPQEPGYLYRLAYEVNFGGRPLIARSYLGLELLNQEPLLGEKDGLIGSHAAAGGGYRSLVANYMQNGSVGRLIDIEARVYDDGVAFRYILPRMVADADLLISEEATEFHFAPGVEAWRAIDGKKPVPMPFATALAGGPFIAILEAKPADFPAVSLVRLDANTLAARLPKLPRDLEVAYHGRTPFAGPWRVIAFGKTRAAALQPAWLNSLPVR